MKPKFLNQTTPSFLLWLDNLICQEGSGHYTTSSLFYRTNSLYYGLTTYASPYSQFIYDSSISGATVMTGIYLNNNYITTGQSGFFGINYEKGQVYFNSALPANSVISGNFSIKDFNVLLTNKPEEKVLFETQYTPRQKTAISPTGLLDNETSYPVIFIKNLGYENQPFAFGGIKTTKINYTSIIFSDDKFKLDSAISIMCDAYQRYVPILDVSEMPFDIYGRLKSGVYNYKALKESKSPSIGNAMFIEESKQAEFSQKLYSEIDNINPNVQVAIVDFSVNTQRTL